MENLQGYSQNYSVPMLATYGEQRKYNPQISRERGREREKE
jgi:hypothetical protein